MSESSDYYSELLNNLADFLVVDVTREAYEVGIQARV